MLLVLTSVPSGKLDKLGNVVAFNGTVLNNVPNGGITCQV